MSSAVGDIWETAVSLREHAEVAEVVFHHRLKVVGSSTDTKTVADGLLTSLATKVEEIMEVVNPASVTSQAISTHRVAGPSGTSRYYSRFTAIEGGLESGNTMPAQCAILCSKYSETNTKSGRGRLYWPFPNSTIVNSGQILDSVILSLDGKFEAILLLEFMSGPDDEWEPVVYSRVGGIGHLITDMVVRPVLASQKRRVVHKQPTYSDS